MSKALYISEKPSRRFVRRLPADLEVSVVRSREIAEALTSRQPFDLYLVDVGSGFAASSVSFITNHVYQPYIVLVQGKGFHSLTKALVSADSIISYRPTPDAVRELADNMEYPELYLVNKGNNRGRCSIH
ncbi:MAG: hypothetical protein L6427_07755 [Actinomycetia bacterium]|nr:hypothetical protein [Actinomycetes bacterium]MCG2817752.1 hypothetical protein [Actinomycetes bacterium]